MLTNKLFQCGFLVITRRASLVEVRDIQLAKNYKKLTIAEINDKQKIINDRMEVDDKTIPLELLYNVCRKKYVLYLYV